MILLNENKLDANRLYFHGSMSPRKNTLEKPSFRYPFYITADLEYAMAFANKDYSSTGGSRDLAFGEQGYVYPISINENARFFDFRHIETDQLVRQAMLEILTPAVFDLAYEQWRKHYGDNGRKMTDIWEFGYVIAELVYNDKNGENNKPGDVAFDPVRGIYRKPGKISAAAAAKIKSWYPFVRDGEAHEMLQVIFEQLSNRGYDGVITTETDFDGDENEVYTDYAVGIWNIDGFGLMYGAALKYQFCKKIQSESISSDDAEGAILRFIDKYKRLFGKKE